MKMHPMERQFRKETIENPRDDTIRLIFADWLEEHGGRPQLADMIRVQVELAQRCFNCDVTGRYVKPKKANRVVGQVKPECCRTCELAYRDVELRRQVIQPTTEKLASRGINLKHKRGFVWSAKMNLKNWLEVGPLMVRLHPLERITIADKKPRLRDGGKFGWFVYPETSERDIWFLAADDLPKPVWSRLSDFSEHTKTTEGGGWKMYDTRESASMALRKAAVEYALAQPDPITTE